MPSKRLLYLGLVLAIFANAMTIGFLIGWGAPYMLPGNVSAIVVCLGAIWLVRNRERFQR